MAGKALVGLDLAFTSDVVSQYASSRSSGFAFIAIDLFHPKTILCNGSIPDSSALPATRSDLVYKRQGLYSLTTSFYVQKILSSL
ncbi:hypothetical protein AHF37_11112 [Paragonimus kellicotti]|nr:hypothetical protein AHF37_11112 [Paragonimus kellicotti]